MDDTVACFNIGGGNRRSVNNHAVCRVNIECSIVQAEMVKAATAAAMSLNFFELT